MAKNVKRCSAFFHRNCPIFREIVAINPGKGSLIAGFIMALLGVPAGTKACDICGEASQCEAV